MYVVVAVEAVIVGMARLAVIDGQRIDKSRVLCRCRVITAGSTGVVASAAVLSICGTSMVPACRYPGACAVAIIAGVGRCHVRSVLAFRDPAIVARGALPRLGRAVVVVRPQPGGSVEVTAFAWRIGYQMGAGFRRCDDAPPECMAAFAISGCALEQSSRMAGFTGCRGMSAGKRKAGSHVIEITPAGLSFGGRLQRGHG